MVSRIASSAPADRRDLAPGHVGDVVHAQAPSGPCPRWPSPPVRASSVAGEPRQTATLTGKVVTQASAAISTTYAATTTPMRRRRLLILPAIPAKSSTIV